MADEPVIAPGAADLAAARAAIVEPLQRVLSWVLGHAEPSTGALICREHGVEHTGKSAGAVVLATELARHAPEGDRDRLFEAARAQCARIAGRLEREGDSTCFTFRPGRHDPYNCSNSVIDGGACSDALATFVLAFGDRLPAEERERYVHASVLHAQTYLRYAIVDKGVPAQCAWAMTGAAQAYRLSGHEVLRFACEVGEERIAARQHGDGSFPYHPLDWGAAHPGAGDASAYYQSRVTAFMSFALESAMGAEAGAAADTSAAAALDFLHGLVGPDGIKVGSVEAKPWYWGAEYEVASHPFDIAAFAVEWRRTRAPRAAEAMRASWRSWLFHLKASGEPQSHLPGLHGERPRTKSYQCPFFWAAHACWIARSIPELSEALASEVRDPAPPRGWRIFGDVDVARLDTEDVVAWIRGARPAGNRSHGSPAGGLLRVYSHATGGDLYQAPYFERRSPANWSGSAGGFNPARGWRSGGADLRFSTWIARTRVRAGEGMAALGAPFQALRRSVASFASSAVSTAFVRDARLHGPSGGEVGLDSGLAFRDGSPAGGRFERRFRRVGEALEVEERVGDPGHARGLWFRPPLGATVLVDEPEHIRYRFGRGSDEGTV